MVAPKVTVLMPVYNGGRFLREAIESILAQTMRDFEFLIIDDGSTDESAAIVESYKDERIRAIRNERNLGLIETLNKGLKLAQGRYVARMDADDLSLPGRLERQLAYMERHPDICVASSYFRSIDVDRRVITTHKSETREFLVSFKRHVEGYNPICHPAVMFNAQQVRDAGGYRAEFPYAEDGELWFRLDSLGMKFGVVPHVLFLHRLHSQQITQTKIDEGMRSHFTAHAQFLSRLLGERPGIEDVTRLSPYWFERIRVRNSAELEAMLQLKRRIALAFFVARELDGPRVVSCVAELWSSLYHVRKFNFVQAGYPERLWRYSLDILEQGLPRNGGHRNILYRGLFAACLMRLLLGKMWARCLKVLRQPSASPAQTTA